MILADKIIDLRKKQGWNQEQLAEQLGVSRQSVSKWESALSIPDMDKIVKMSNLFGVSTDYLLKDEIEAPQPGMTDGSSDYEGVYISVETANRYMNTVSETAGKIAIAVAMFILSPVPLIFLGGLSEYSGGFWTENMAGGIGAAILLVIIAAGVTLIVTNDMKLEKYSYIEKEDIVLEYGLDGIVEKKMEEYSTANVKMIALGIALCILGVVPLLLTAGLENDFISVLSLCSLLMCIAMGVYCLILTETINDSYKRLLQIKEFTPQKKLMKKKLAFLPGVYWCTVTAVYLAVSFYNNSWDSSWVIWPVASMLYLSVLGIAGEIATKEK